MVRLMTYNIQEGGGPDRRKKRAFDVIERASPDLLVVNEAVGWHPRHPDADALAARLGAEYRVAASASGFDLALFSRFPIREFQQPDVPALFHSLAWIAVDLPGDLRLYLIGTHLDYREEALRVREAEAVFPYLDSLLESPAALLGDLNAIAPDDRVMGLRPDELGQMDLAKMPDWFLQRYPPEVMSRFFAAGWHDAFRMRNPDQTGYTMSTTDPNARYDFVLLSPPLENTVVNAFVETAPPASNASDHFAVVADLDV